VLQEPELVCRESIFQQLHRRRSLGGPPGILVPRHGGKNEQALVRGKSGVELICLRLFSIDGRAGALDHELDCRPRGRRLLL
jgi:hypothetical protein